MPKVMLITGCSTGLGLSIAIQGAQAGFTVYATMRNLSKRQKLDDAASAARVSLNVLRLDVQDTASVNAAVDRIIAEQGRVDVLVANAGAGFVRSTEQASEADIQQVMDVNFMGLVRCVKALLPHMRTARSGRVVAISSVGGLVGQPFNEIYCAAKFAVEGYLESLATYVGPAFGIDFTIVEPGGISSEFASSALEQVEASGGMLDDEYLPLLKKYIGGRGERPAGLYQTCDEVAAVVMACVHCDDPPVRTRTSPWSEEFTKLKTIGDPDGKTLRAKVIADLLGDL